MGKKNNPSSITISTWIEIVLLTCAIAYWKKTGTVTASGVPTTFSDFLGTAFITTLVMKITMGVWGGILVLGYKNKALAYNVYRYLIFIPLTIAFFAASPDKQRVVTSFSFSPEEMLPVFMLFVMPAALLSVPVGIIGIVKFLGRAADSVSDSIKQEEADKNRDRRLKELQINKLEEVSEGSAPALDTESRIPCPMCAEKILPAAKICPFCKSDLGTQNKPQPQ